MCVCVCLCVSVCKGYVCLHYEILHSSARVYVIRVRRVCHDPALTTHMCLPVVRRRTSGARALRVRRRPATRRSVRSPRISLSLSVSLIYDVTYISYTWKQAHTQHTHNAERPSRTHSHTRSASSIYPYSARDKIRYKIVGFHDAYLSYLILSIYLSELAAGA